MNKEHPAFKQWKAEGDTPDTAQVVQDARLDFVMLKEKLSGVEAQIRAFKHAHDISEDAEEKTALGAELVNAERMQAELERQIEDSEQEFKDIGTSPDMQTLN